MDTAIVQLPVITLQLVHHRGSQWILITGQDTIKFNAAIRQIEGRRYSATYRSWVLPPNRQSYQQLLLALQNKATIDTTTLNAGLRTPAIPLNNVIKSPALPSPAIETINKEVLPQMLQHMQLRHIVKLQYEPI